jgi:hypothetical protein
VRCYGARDLWVRFGVGRGGGMTADRSPETWFSLAGWTVRSCPAPKEGGKEWAVRGAVRDREGLNCRRMRRMERRRAVKSELLEGCALAVPPKNTKNARRYRATAWELCRGSTEPGASPRCEPRFWRASDQAACRTRKGFGPVLAALRLLPMRRRRARPGSRAA